MLINQALMHFRFELAGSLARLRHPLSAIYSNGMTSRTQGKSIRPPGKSWICTKTPTDRRFPGNNRFS
jgi:hypothetical protein